MSRSFKSSTEAETARWFAARRRGVMTLEERAQYELWRRDSANRAAMDEFERVWTALEEARDHLGGPQPAFAPRRSKIARSALVAVMCAVSIGIGVLSYSGNSGFWTALDWTDR